MMGIPPAGQLPKLGSFCIFRPAGTWSRPSRAKLGSFRIIGPRRGLPAPAARAHSRALGRNWVRFAQFPSSHAPQASSHPAPPGKLGLFRTIGPFLARRPPDVPSCPSLALFCTFAPRPHVFFFRLKSSIINHKSSIAGSAPDPSLPLPVGRVARIVPEFCARTTLPRRATRCAQRNKRFFAPGVLYVFNCCRNVVVRRVGNPAPCRPCPWGFRGPALIISFSEGGGPWM